VVKLEAPKIKKQTIIHLYKL